MEEKKAAFLLVSGSQDCYWHSVLKEALVSLGNLRVIAEEEAIQDIVERDYRAIIVDAGTVDEFSFLVSRLRARCEGARIIVVTTSPTWQRAREAFQSGATDYIRKSPNKEDLLTSLQTALARPVFPWPR